MHDGSRHISLLGTELIGSIAQSIGELIGFDGRANQLGEKKRRARLYESTHSTSQRVTRKEANRLSVKLGQLGGKFKEMRPSSGSMQIASSINRSVEEISR
ncbi:hypothetical protein KI387_029457, partial [Taxus chinensis]